MRTLTNPRFILCALAALANQLLQWQGYRIWPLHSHLDDLLALPLSLSLVLAAERLYFRNPAFVLPLRLVLLAWLFFSVVFELALPLLSRVYTPDAWDVLAYGLGAVLFQVSINRPLT